MRGKLRKRLNQWASLPTTRHAFLVSCSLIKQPYLLLPVVLEGPGPPCTALIVLPCSVVSALLHACRHAGDFAEQPAQ